MNEQTETPGTDSTYDRVKRICDHIRGVAKVEVSDSDLLSQDEYRLATQLLISAYEIKGSLSKEEAILMYVFSDKLLKITLRAHEGNLTAQRQLKAIERLIEAERYDLTTDDFEKIASLDHSDASRSRGYALRRLMGELSFSVHPANYRKSNSIHDGPVRLRPHPLFSDRVVTEALVAKHLKPQSTLQSLAISIYLEQLHNEGFKGIDKKTLKDDLRELELWEKEHPFQPENYDVSILGQPGSYDAPVLGGKDLPYIFGYSERWKLRKKGSGGKRVKKTRRAQESNLAGGAKTKRSLPPVIS